MLFAWETPSYMVGEIVGYTFIVHVVRCLFIVTEDLAGEQTNSKSKAISAFMTSLFGGVQRRGLLCICLHIRPRLDYICST